jgi:PKD repeat protein
MKCLKFAILVLLCQLFFFSARAQFPTVNVTNNINPSNGYTFLATFWTGVYGKYYLLILNKEGKIVYAKSFPFGMNGGYLDFKPQPNNKYSFFDSKQNCFYIMDKFFNIIDTVTAKNGYTTNCHELIMSKDNHYFIIADETRIIDMSTIVTGGSSNAQVTGNVIQEIDSNDNLLFEWKTLDHFAITDHAGDLTSPAFDFTHTNGLFLDTDTSLLVSNPEFNEITKISINSGNIIWRMGLNAKSNQFTFIGDTLGFKFQHYPSRLANGNITLFDNGMSHYSRAIEYEIDEVNKTAELVFEYRNTPDIHAWSMGSAIRIANGNTFISWGSVPKMTEADTAGNKVFEASFPSGTYRALKYDISNPISELIAGPSEICKGQTATYTALGTSYYTYSWSVTNGVIVNGQGTNTITVRWLSDGQGIVRLTQTNTLNYKDYLSVFVNVFPKPSASIGVVQNCKEVFFTDNTTNSLSRFWDLGDSTTSNLTAINHMYKSTGIFPVKLVVTNDQGCTDSSMLNISIPDTLDADFSMDTVFCSSEAISIINHSTNADAYYWYLDDSLISVLKNPETFYCSEAGPHTIKLVILLSGCVDFITKTILVNPSPKAHLSFTEICNGGRYIDSSINVVNRLWDFGDGNTSALPEISHLYSSPGTYPVKLKVTNSFGCYDSSMQSIHITDAPKADFYIDSMICLSDSLSIISKSLHADAHLWFLEDSVISGLQNPFSISFPTFGSYKIKLITTSPFCIDSMVKTVIVNPSPEAQFSTIEICKGAQFIDSTNNAINRSWDFGDGDTSSLSDISHIYSLPGLYPVTLKVTNRFGCSDSSIKNVLISDAPMADFSIDSTICASEVVSIINKSTHADSYSWDLGNTEISNLSTPLPFTYITTGTYTVKLIAKNTLCTDSLSKKIVVNPNPTAQLRFSEICQGAHFIDSSLNTVNRIWDLGDGNTSQSTELDHLYNSPGIYPVSLKVFNHQGCADSLTKSINIHKAPKADFSMPSSVCASETISIVNHSTDAHHYYWDLGDSISSTLMTPEEFSHSTAGTYDIKLIASTSFCSDSLIQTLLVNPTPEVKFGFKSLTDSSIQFSDSSSISNGSILSWEWDFGDGFSSSIQHPVHTYSIADTYRVELCVTSDAACVHCSTKSIYIATSSINKAETGNTIQVFPNPNRGFFSISSTNKIDLVVITNAFGQEVKVIKPNTNTEQIDLTNKPNGVYFIKISLENQDHVIRIIKN